MLEVMAYHGPGYVMHLDNIDYLQNIIQRNFKNSKNGLVGMVFHELHALDICNVVINSFECLGIFELRTL